jgi:phage major head subunit gpT-like protein
MSAIGLGSRAIIGEFYARLEQNVGAEWVDGVSMLFQSDQDSETYRWLGMAPAMREWVGGRLAKGFRENGITITNKEYEATLEVLTRELRRDKTGQILVRVREMADRANAHWASLLSTLMINGPSTACYDAQYFFDTDHSEGDSGTQDNDLSIDISALPAAVHGSITVPSVEEMQLCILQAVNAIIGFKDDKGEPMNENAAEFLIQVAPALYPASVAAIKDTVQISIATNNPGAQTSLAATGFKFKVASNARLAAWTSSFAVFDMGGSTKAFIRQEEVPLQIDAVAEGSELEFNEKKHHYGIWASRNVGYGYWQKACFVTMT